ncbi:MAG: TonB-dependent receptor, partial [Saprospiraceae bacterium]|nr:TonB-dependent receptor [Saprospiraceae bacterium]
GQGYADLHFLIPEIIERIDFGKGPHEADRGNFATAGHIDFRTKNDLGESSVSMELGEFNTRRLFAGLDLFEEDQARQGFVDLEYLTGDGPFVSTQVFSRTNIMGKYAVKFSQGDQLNLQASYFSSSWDASGQIPEASGQIWNDRTHWSHR